MDEKRNAQSDIPRKDESAKQAREGAGISKEAAGSPRAGTTPTGQRPQRAGAGEPREADLSGDKDVPAASYQPGQGGKGGGGYQPGQSERAGGTTSGPGQAGEGQGGPGDRTNLSGMGGPEKSNWNQDPDQGPGDSQS
jgi:hypothetical protein